MSETLHNEIFNKNIFTTLSITVHNFEMGISCSLPPFCGHALMPWLSSGSGAVVVGINISFHLMKQGCKATLPLAARIPLCLGGSTLHQDRRHRFIQNLTQRGTYLLHPPFWSCKLWLHSLSSCDSHLVHYLMTSTGSYILPSAKHM